MLATNQALEILANWSNPAIANHIEGKPNLDSAAETLTQAVTSLTVEKHGTSFFYQIDKLSRLMPKVWAAAEKKHPDLVEVKKRTTAHLSRKVLMSRVA